MVMNVVVITMKFVFKVGESGRKKIMIMMAMMFYP